MVKKLSSDTGLIFDIQSYSVHDGPGCRTTVFLAGCFLKCRWCANPESWELKEKLMFARTKCRHTDGCARCLKACGRQGIVENDQGKIEPDWNKCKTCTEFTCAAACHAEALKVCGRHYTTGELMRIISRDRGFWGQDGGVTFGGGEPFYQKGFLTSMVKKCKEAYIHTAIETTAYVNPEDFLATMPYIDFAFIDIKHMDSIRHKEQTGVGNELILDNISALAQSNWPGRLVLRMPVIEEFNDCEDNIAGLADFMEKLGLFEINLLPFHRLGDSKWAQLGKTYAYQEYTATSQEKLEELQAIFLERRIACYIGSDTAF